MVCWWGRKKLEVKRETREDRRGEERSGGTGNHRYVQGGGWVA